MKALTLTSFLFLLSCGEKNNALPDMGKDINTQIDMKTDADAIDDSGKACEPLQDSFIDAVRGLGRSCFDHVDCQLALRAGPCDCAIGIGPGQQDTADFQSNIDTFDAQRTLLDDNQCRNPFTCVGNKCPNYNTLSNPGELIPRCRGGECEVVQLPSCADYESKKTGGLFTKSECESKADCSIRTNLNPCSCPEPVSKNFPSLVGGVIREIIDINNARCGTTCGGCPSFTDFDCISDGTRKVCVITK